MTPESLEKKLQHLPTKPGVYLMKDARGEIIYVGKAKSLRARVKSHFAQDYELSLRSREMIRRVADVDTIVVGSERRRCCWRPTSSSRTTRASTSSSGTTSATRTSR